MGLLAWLKKAVEPRPSAPVVSPAQLQQGKSSARISFGHTAIMLPGRWEPGKFTATTAEFWSSMGERLLLSGTTTGPSCGWTGMVDDEVVTAMEFLTYKNRNTMKEFAPDARVEPVVFRKLPSRVEGRVFGVIPSKFIENAWMVLADKDHAVVFTFMRIHPSAGAPIGEFANALFDSIEFEKSA